MAVKKEQKKAKNQSPAKKTLKGSKKIGETKLMISI